MGRVAPPHDAVRFGSSVRDVDEAASPKRTPELTLDRTVRLLEAAMEQPQLKVKVKLARATALVSY